MSAVTNDEQIVMTPTKRSRDHTTVTMERLKVSDMDKNNIIHVAGGDHKGIVIFKEPGSGKSVHKPPELVLGFKVMLKSSSSNKHAQENWQLKFWFKNADDQQKIESAESFLNELVSAGEYPRDYVGFITKTMKLMQLKYPCVQKVEVEMRKQDEVKIPPPTLAKPIVDHRILEQLVMDQQTVGHRTPDHRTPDHHTPDHRTPDHHTPDHRTPDHHTPDHNAAGHHTMDNHAGGPHSVAEHPTITMEQQSIEEQNDVQLSETQEKILDIVEAVYPNSLSVANIARSSNISDEEAQEVLITLQARGLIKCLNNGNYMRTTKSDTGDEFPELLRNIREQLRDISSTERLPDVKMVKQMPMVAAAKQPIIAIITAQYCEKLAVDAMIDNKETFVKFKTEGESNVYTLGTIGPHRVVSTKLPATGMARGAMIAAGSTTTRLLGTFPRVDFVFLVGVGGGVPHYRDYTKHVRLGDVVVSTPPDSQHPYVYLYCEGLKNAVEEEYLSPEHFSTKTWCPTSLKLQNITYNLWRKGIINMEDRPWEHYIEQSLRQLKESSFCRPSSETDKLYVSIGGEDLMEVGHPQPVEGTFDPRKPNMPVLHFGAVGSGKVLLQDDTTRLGFADHYGIMAFDTGFGSVVESIFGNRKDDYIFIRGIADYKDGTKKKEWQPYAALAAASVMKSIISNLDPSD